MTIITNPAHNHFLPDFCAAPMVFSVVVLGELLAFVLALTPYSPVGDPWRDLALISLFVQWVGLSSIAVLCGLRGWLHGFSNGVAGLVSFLMVMLVSALFSEVAFRLVDSGLIEINLYSAMQLSGGSYWFSQADVVEVPLSGDWHSEFLLRNLGVSAIVGALALRYFYVQYQWKMNLELEAQARVQALQSRIRPHFLFNCMNTIASFIRSKPDLAEQVVEDLSDLFRVSLGDATVPVTVSREFDVGRQYLRIEALRLGERLTVEWDVDAAAGDVLIPALSLQPILENAVYHGIEPAADGGTVRISAQSDGKRMQIAVTNTVDDAAPKLHHGNQMAQQNVSERLHAFFDGRGELRVDTPPGEYRVVLEFPVITELPR